MTNENNTGLTLQTITRAADLESLRADFDNLNRQAPLALPFALYEWHRTWCDHFLEAGERIKDSLLVMVVRADDGNCVGIVPIIRTRRSVGPVAVCSLSLLGADPALTEIRMPLIAPGFHAPVARLVQQKLATIAPWDWMQWTGLTVPVSAAADLRWQTPIKDFVLDLPGDWDTFRKSLKRNIRESLRHCYNSLKRDNLQYSLVVLARPAELQVGLDCFLRLHAMRAQQQGTVMHHNHFARESAQAFLRDVCGRLAERNITRVFQFIVDGQVVATRIGFVMGDSLYLYYSGFDPAWGRYSVMTTLLAEIIKLAMAEGLRTINLSPGEDVAKTRWSPREVPIVRVLQVGGRLRSGLACSLYVGSTQPANRRGWVAKMLAQAQRRWA